MRCPQCWASTCSRQGAWPKSAPSRPLGLHVVMWQAHARVCPLQMRAELAKIDVLVVPTSAYNYTVQEIQVS